MNLRAATMDDAELLLEWANDPDVRAASFNSAPITLDEHITWLKNRLPKGGFYIAEEDGRPVGYARVDTYGMRGELSLCVDAGSRSRGLGRVIIAAAARLAAEELQLYQIKARVKPDNVASLRAFTEAGFTLTWQP